jgi:hypothetical protein
MPKKTKNSDLHKNIIIKGARLHNLKNIDIEIKSYEPYICTSVDDFVYLLGTNHEMINEIKENIDLKKKSILFIQINY